MADYSPEILGATDRVLIELMLDTQRAEIAALLKGISDVEARANLVPSLTTLLGLVKHAAFVERVWFGHRVAGRTRSEVGIPDEIDGSFRLAESDSVEFVLVDFAAACADSRAIAADHPDLGEMFPWRFGPVSLAFIYAHMIQEYARHCGHGDILREQLIANRL